MNKQEAYKEKAGAELEMIGAELNRLKAIAEKAKAEQRATLDHYIGSLEQRRQELGDKLESIKDNSADALEDLQHGLREAWDRLDIARKAAKARFH